MRVSVCVCVLCVMLHLLLTCFFLNLCCMLIVSQYRYLGKIEPVDPRAGHIPGAVNAPFSANSRPDHPGYFLPPDDLKARFLSVDACPDRRPIFYCGSGITACNNLLAYEHAGLGRAQLYVGSWSQWSNDKLRPCATDP